MPSPGEPGQALELALVRQLQEHLPVFDFHRKRTVLGEIAALEA